MGAVASSINCFIISDIFSCWGRFFFGGDGEIWANGGAEISGTKGFSGCGVEAFGCFLIFGVGAGTGTVGMDRLRDSSRLLDGEALLGFLAFSDILNGVTEPNSGSTGASLTVGSILAG
ncbi:MAG: hypothetical protein MRJ67_10460 [Nitrospirales bacterium]|nr:hypothetical protein [Nitrospirales bacterium]